MESDGDSFAWGPAKNEATKKKHGVSFEEASEAFDDPHLQIAHDPGHSDDEIRFISLGRTRAGKLLLIAHTDRFGVIRIISARGAENREERFYKDARFRNA